jgi:hypothetical protein
LLTLLGFLVFVFDVLFEIHQVDTPHVAILFQPAIDAPKGPGIQAVQPVAAFAPLSDEIRFVKDPQMFRNGGTADGKRPGELIDGLGSAPKLIENRATGDIGDRVEDIGCDWVLRHECVTKR